MSRELVNRDLIRQTLTHEAAWANSHGAYDDFLGMGLLYYSLVYVLKVRVAVCLGSGGGFVPRLMRQAQRDLGMAQESRTVLVDANRPEAGWSSPLWLDKNSFFRTTFSDIEIHLMTTAEAADRIFAPKGLHIDYLHIDADHSFRACIEDFQRYRRFLKAGSLVTLHDTSFPGAGVKGVIDYLRMRNDCELIDFPEIQAGTALVRITRELENSGLALSAQEEAGPNPPAVVMTPKVQSLGCDPPEIGWKYLHTEAFSSRSVLAAHFVRDCRAVIEIGGAKTSIDNFLTGTHEDVIVLDPFIAEASSQTLNGRDCRVRHVPLRFQDVEWRIERPQEYGLVMLGLELQGLTAEDYQALYKLVENAKVTVIEFSPSWGPSRAQYEQIRQHTKTRLRFTAELDLNGNDLGDLQFSWPPRCDRQIHVLEPA